MQDQVQILGSHSNDRSQPAKNRQDDGAAVAKHSFFFVAAGVALLALIAQVWAAMMWPLSNDAAAISTMFP
jgi:uncharacterized membrane protein